jgi:aromatic ring-opening dioxygenase catalytic subunit (LigB family)
MMNIDVQTPKAAGHERMPTFFIPHGGGPCFFMEWKPVDTWTRTAAFLRNITNMLPRTPKALLLISGHWGEPMFTITSTAEPSLIYDYSGFPQHTYEIRYDAPGDPALAMRIRYLLASAGVPVVADPSRGFDHGVFIPMKVAFPEADIPIVQLSIRADFDPAAHLVAGRALAPLRDEDVLIIGSGMSVHNMRGFGDPRFGPLSDSFDRWLTTAVESAPGTRLAALTAWANAPAARQCHPKGAEEHLIPLLVAAGAAAGGSGRRIFSERIMETAISGYRFD